MPDVALLLAQCAGALEDCDIPRTLPWYFTLAMVAAWLATVAGIAILARRRIANWLARRPRKFGRGIGEISPKSRPKSVEVERYE